MLIEIRDPTLYERLISLLPRPDTPIDYVFLKLIEQPCKSENSVEMLVELLERSIRKAMANTLELARSN